MSPIQEENVRQALKKYHGVYCETMSLAWNIENSLRCLSGGRALRRLQEDRLAALLQDETRRCYYLLFKLRTFHAAGKQKRRDLKLENQTLRHRIAVLLSQIREE